MHDVRLVQRSCGVQDQCEVCIKGSRAQIICKVMIKVMPLNSTFILSSGWKSATITQLTSAYIFLNSAVQTHKEQ